MHHSDPLTSAPGTDYPSSPPSADPRAVPCAGWPRRPIAPPPEPRAAASVRYPHQYQPAPVSQGRDQSPCRTYRGAIPAKRVPVGSPRRPRKAGGGIREDVGARQGGASSEVLDRCPQGGRPEPFTRTILPLSEGSPATAVASSERVHSGVGTAGDETRTRDIQLGRNVLGVEFRVSRNQRWSAFLQVFAVPRGLVFSRRPSLAPSGSD